MDTAPGLGWAGRVPLAASAQAALTWTSEIWPAGGQSKSVAERSPPKFPRWFFVRPLSLPFLPGTLLLEGAWQPGIIAYLQEAGAQEAGQEVPRDHVCWQQAREL